MGKKILKFLVADIIWGRQYSTLHWYIVGHTHTKIKKEIVVEYMSLLCVNLSQGYGS